MNSRLFSSKQNVESVLSRIKKNQDQSISNSQKMFDFIKRIENNDETHLYDIGQAVHSDPVYDIAQAEHSDPVYDIAQAKSSTPIYDLGQAPPSSEIIKSKSKLILVKLTKHNKTKKRETEQREEKKEEPIGNGLFTTDSWENLIEHFRETTGNIITISPMAGISNRLDGISFLKSVQGTPYYDDDLSDPNNIIYTLFGQVGDQNINDRFNKPLLQRAKQIYLYEVNPKNKKNKYTWYGEYKINGQPMPKQHKDINGIMRTIYLINLVKV